MFDFGEVLGDADVLSDSEGRTIEGKSVQQFAVKPGAEQRASAAPEQTMGGRGAERKPIVAKLSIDQTRLDAAAKPLLNPWPRAKSNAGRGRAVISKGILRPCMHCHKPFREYGNEGNRSGGYCDDCWDAWYGLGPSQTPGGGAVAPAQQAASSTGVTASQQRVGELLGNNALAGTGLTSASASAKDPPQTAHSEASTEAPLLEEATEANDFDSEDRRKLSVANDPRKLSAAAERVFPDLRGCWVPDSQWIWNTVAGTVSHALGLSGGALCMGRCFTADEAQLSERERKDLQSLWDDPEDAASSRMASSAKEAASSKMAPGAASSGTSRFKSKKATELKKQAEEGAAGGGSGDSGQKPSARSRGVSVARYPWRA
mmetsp:Transcript_52835/g.113177  ORF Transcript_52835/g.113177 Transcript_52835/m.113177 type:complete len:374 (+) Transcript_52835:30-1151(+)